jgi:hypothetical protein
MTIKCQIDKYKLLIRQGSQAKYDIEIKNEQIAESRVIAVCSDLGEETKHFSLQCYNYRFVQGTGII